MQAFGGASPTSPIGSYDIGGVGAKDLKRFLELGATGFASARLIEGLGRKAGTEAPMSGK